MLAKEIDDPFEPIQAQPATIELLTYAQTGFGIQEFYSEDDEEWLIKFFLIPMGGIQRTIFYTSTTADLFFFHSSTDNYIIIGNEASVHGFKAGQTIEIKGKTYNITNVSYDATTQSITISVFETVVTQSLIGTEVEITVYDVLSDGLIYTGFILQDESADAFISYDHFIRLTATDNLGLLSSIDFATACGNIGKNSNNCRR